VSAFDPALETNEVVIKNTKLVIPDYAHIQSKRCVQVICSVMAREPC
jgi:hypothetical protein